MKGRELKTIIFLGLFLMLLIIPLTSAGLFDNFYNKITGKATQDITTLNITIGNSAPTITFVQVISAQNPTDDTTTSITFNFTVTDTDGAANINTTSGRAYFQRAGETTRSNVSCASQTGSGNDMNFTCTIDMWYFDENGAWDINVTAKDINDASDENSSETFTYNLLPGMKMSPSSLAWDPIGVSDTNTGSNNDPVQINNTGNDIDLNINVTSFDLQGETTATQYIFANNFTIENITEGCTGTGMINATSINVTSSILQRGNNTLNYNNATSGQEQIHVCLLGVPQDISAQSYSSAAYGSWTIKIVS